ncbi:MAG: phage major capsid protein [Coriobacteriia bacterium]|nr:phage major capsid protein [Coriobacteriia bacterium]
MPSSGTLLNTKDITLPREVSNEIFKKAQGSSTIATLAQAEPQKFGEYDVMTFDLRPRAEFVGESQQKSGAEFAFGKRTVRPYKTQVTMRFSDEVKWADEDLQLGVLQELGLGASEALGRALDLGSYHGINPLTGLQSTVIGDHYLIKDATNIVYAGDAPDIDVESAAGLVIMDHFRPNGMAFDMAYAWRISTARYADGHKKYPDLGLGIDISSFENIRSSVSDTVSGGVEVAAPTDLLAVVGDWSAYRWGVQRNIGLSRCNYFTSPIKMLSSCGQAAIIINVKKLLRLVRASYQGPLRRSLSVLGVK